jgi:CBS domain-containing membrane protein
MVDGVATRALCHAAVSLASTGALMILFGVVHFPAGAATLIVSLGIITDPLHLLAIEAAVALIVVQAIVVHRWRGIAYPLWCPRQEK